MEYFILIAVVSVCVLVFKNKKKPTKKKKAVDSFSLPVDKAQRRYMSKNVPELLRSYIIFTPAFLSRYASLYLSSGRSARLSDKDILPGVEPARASWVLNHCIRLASARYNNERAIKEARAAEASSLDVKLQRACKSCDRVPAEKNYKLNSSIPIYPCADCDKNDFCVFWYQLNF